MLINSEIKLLKKELAVRQSYLYSAQFSRFPVSESEYIETQKLAAKIADLESQQPKKESKGIFSFLKF